MTSFLLSSLLVHFCLHSSLSSSATQLQPIHHATGTCFGAAFPFPHPQDLCLNLLRLLKTPSCLQEASDLQQSSAPCRKGLRRDEEGERETEAGPQGGSADPSSAYRQHPTSTPKTWTPCCSRWAATQGRSWPLRPSSVASWLWSRCIWQALDQAWRPP